MKITFTKKPLSQTEAGKLLKNQKSLSASVAMKERIKDDPSFQYRNIDNGYIFVRDRWLWVRSRWEANIVCYLEYLRQIGEIEDWQYEKVTFWFEGIKRGTNNYKPDFVVTEKGGFVVYWEVKGYMDKKSAVKLKRMKKYHPFIIVELIDKRRYLKISKNKGLYPGWDQPLKKKKE